MKKCCLSQVVGGAPLLGSLGLIGKQLVCHPLFQGKHNSLKPAKVDSKSLALPLPNSSSPFLKKLSTCKTSLLEGPHLKCQAGGTLVRNIFIASLRVCLCVRSNVYGRV